MGRGGAVVCQRRPRALDGMRVAIRTLGGFASDVSQAKAERSTTWVGEARLGRWMRAKRERPRRAAAASAAGGGGAIPTIAVSPPLVKRSRHGWRVRSQPG